MALVVTLLLTGCAAQADRSLLHGQRRPDPCSELASDTVTVTGADTGTVTIPVDPDTGGGGAPVTTPVDGTPRFIG